MEYNPRTQTVDSVRRSTPRPMLEWAIFLAGVALVFGYLGVFSVASLWIVVAIVVAIVLVRRAFPEPGYDEVVRPLTSWEQAERDAKRRAVDVCLASSMPRAEAFLNVERPLTVPSWATLSAWKAIDDAPDVVSASVVAVATLTMRGANRETSCPVRTNPNTGMIYGAHPEDLSERALENMRSDALAAVNKALAYGADELGIARGVA